MTLLHKLYNPEIFQGNLKKRNYFEGWYYKIVSGDEKRPFAIIPGVSIGREGADHAFIQILDGKNAKSHYYSFEMELFQADDKILDIQIGNNKFNKEKITLNLPEMKGELSINNLHPIPTSILSPGIMGWYSFVPGMQCYHGIVSMYHTLEGQLSYKNENISFDNGIGYLEKDWGTSFPKCWIWAHSNHFDHNENISIMTSVAHIPWMGNYFVGFLVTLMIGSDQEIFATYNGSKRQCWIKENKVYLSFRRKNKMLSIICTPSEGAELKTPIQGMMTGKVNESLQATIELEYYINNTLTLSTRGINAGLEVAGDIKILLSQKWSSK